MKKTSLLSPTLAVVACLFAAPAAAQAPVAAPTQAPAAPPAVAAETTAQPSAASAPAEAAAPAESTLSTSPPSPTEPAAEVAPAATATTSTPPVPPPTVTVVETPYMKRFLPEGNMWELGILGGVMFPSSEHQLFDPELGTGAQRPFDTAGEIGLRVAYFPLSFLGVEAEAAAMPSSVDVGAGGGSTSGGLWAVRGHVIGQFPGISITPFVLVGFGALGASSDAMGNDVDDALHFGAGVKVPLDEHLSLRFDLRDTVHRQVNASSGSGTHSPEILLGLTFVPKRRAPDADGDGYVDYNDSCPAIAGQTIDGKSSDCPPPDQDGDGVTDDKDECPELAGVTPVGCPDQDGDGLLDRVDPCPTQAGPLPSGCPEKACPVQDTDGDGITDAADQCPAEAAATVTGCPLKDADGDLVPDDLDQCPDAAETKDGVTDEDGCPEVVEEPVGKDGPKGEAKATTAPAKTAATANPTPTAKPPAAPATAKTP
jgi:hypothetical protein